METKTGLTRRGPERDRSLRLTREFFPEDEVKGRQITMFDPKPYLENRTLLEPISTPVPAEFPHTEELPEGCQLLTGLQDWGYRITEIPDVVYVHRQVPGPDGTAAELPLHLHLLVPCLHNSATEEEKAKPRTWPLLVHVQGSAFMKQNLWANLGRHIRLVEKGVAVAIVEYRDSSQAPFPAQVEDAKTAIRFLRLHAGEYDLDPRRIALSGDSSGGHTALIAGFSGDEGPDTPVYSGASCLVNCIVDCYAPTVFSLMNFEKSAENHYDGNSPEGRLLRCENILERPDLVEPTIPMNYLSPEKATPPVLILHGSRDMQVPFQQSCLLYTYMKEMGKQVTMYKINDANHGCLGFDSDVVVNLVFGFLEQYNVPSGPER